MVGLLIQEKTNWKEWGNPESMGWTNFPNIFILPPLKSPAE
jgi:hypothetical protein